MAVYAVKHLGLTGVAVGDKFVLQAGAYELRLLDVALNASSNDPSYVARLFFTPTRLSSATMSGGTASPIVSYREGVPPPSATAKATPTVSGSNSTQLVLNAQNQFDNETTILPGSALVLTVDYVYHADNVAFGSRFEELLLAWHY